MRQGRPSLHARGVFRGQSHAHAVRRHADVTRQARQRLHRGDIAHPFALHEVIAHGSRRRWLHGMRTDRSESMIRKLPDGQYRLYSRKPDPKTGKRRNLGTFRSREAAEKHEREVQYFKRGH